MLEHRTASSLAAAVGPHDRAFAEAVSSQGLRAAAGHPALVHPAAAAFVNGLNGALVIGCAAVFVGSVAAAALIRAPTAAPQPATEPSRS